MRLAVVGSRTIIDVETVWTLMNLVTKKYPIDTIVSGAAPGVDLLAKSWVDVSRITTIPGRYGEKFIYLEFPADWNKYGKSAGMMRNKHIVDNADIVLAVWDGVSPGTANTIDLAKQAGKMTIVYSILKKKMEVFNKAI